MGKKSGTKKPTTKVKDLSTKAAVKGGATDRARGGEIDVLSRR